MDRGAGSLVCGMRALWQAPDFEDGGWWLAVVQTEGKRRTTCGAVLIRKLSVVDFARSTSNIIDSCRREKGADGRHSLTTHETGTVSAKF